MPQGSSPAEAATDSPLWERPQGEASDTLWLPCALELLESLEYPATVTPLQRVPMPGVHLPIVTAQHRHHRTGSPTQGKLVSNPGQSLPCTHTS